MLLFLLALLVLTGALDAFLIKRHFCTSTTRRFDTNILIDELARESGNVAHFLGGAVGLLGKGAWEVGKNIVPVIGKVAGGVIDTVAPVVTEKTSDAINYAAPIVQGKAQEVVSTSSAIIQAKTQAAIEYGVPFAQEKADQAAREAAILVQQLKDGQAGKNLATTLRQAAGAIDPTGAAATQSTVKIGGMTVSNPFSSPSPTYVNPLVAKINKLEVPPILILIPIQIIIPILHLTSLHVTSLHFRTN